MDSGARSGPSSKRPIDLVFDRPALRYREEFARWLADWMGDEYEPYGWIFKRAWADFPWYVALCEEVRANAHPPELAVPLEAHWAFSEGELVGELYIFYAPMRGDNHIGYKVRPSARRRGVARALLDYGLQALRAKGISEARLTCDSENVASGALIESVGGKRLSDLYNASGTVSRRYVIELR
jgi:predicted acetyltransferase